MENYNFVGLRGFNLITESLVLENTKAYRTEWAARAAKAMVILMKNRGKKDFPRKWPLVEACWTDKGNIVSPGKKLGQVERGCFSRTVSAGEFIQRKIFWLNVRDELQKQEQEIDMTREQAMQIARLNQEVITQTRLGRAIVKEYQRGENAFSPEHHEVFMAIDIHQEHAELAYLAIGPTDGRPITELVVSDRLSDEMITAILAEGEPAPLSMYM